MRSRGPAAAESTPRRQAARACFTLAAVPGIGGKGGQHIRLILPISGLPGFAATREAAIGEIGDARRPSCKRADFRDYCGRPTTGKGDAQR